MTKKVLYGQGYLVFLSPAGWVSNFKEGKAMCRECFRRGSVRPGCCLWTGGFTHSQARLVSLIVKVQEKLKEDSNQKDGRNKKEDEGLERWNRYIVRSDLKTCVWFSCSFEIIDQTHWSSGSTNRKYLLQIYKKFCESFSFDTIPHINSKLCWIDMKRTSGYVGNWVSALGKESK